MKKLLLSILLTVLLITSPAQAEFLSDAIITSPHGIWTDSRAYDTLNDAVDAVGANERTIKIVSPQTITTLTIPSNITLSFERNGSITNSGQLTINTKNITAPNRQIFTGVGNIDFASGSELKTGWFSNIETAFALTSNDTVTLIVSKPQTITASYSPGNNVHLKWENPGNILSINTGRVVGNLKNIEAGDYQILAGAGDFDFLDGTELRCNWFPSLRAANTQVEAEEVTLIISKSTSIDFDITSTENLNYRILKGGYFDIDGGVTFTVYGYIDVGNHTYKSGLGTLVYVGESVYIDESVDHINPKWWGATGDGTTDDTAAMQLAFDYAHSSSLPIHLTKGTYYTGRINWQGNSIIGLGNKRVDVVLKGKPGQDILYAYGGTGSGSVEYTQLKNFKLFVDSSVDVSGSLSRHGVGNAAIAFEKNDGAIINSYWRLLRGSVEKLFIGSTHGPINNSCGMYLQGVPYKVQFEKLVIRDLAYGYYEDYPSVNITSTTMAPDFNSYLNCKFELCTKAFRAVNGTYCYVYNMEINECDYGFYLDEVNSLLRYSSSLWTVINLRTETPTATEHFYITGSSHTFINLSRLDDSLLDTKIDCSYSTFINPSFQHNAANYLKINGDYNKFINCSLPYPKANDLGIGNYIDLQRAYSGPSSVSPLVLTRNKPTSNSRDNISGYLGIVDNLFKSALDTLIAPDEPILEGGAGNQTITSDKNLELGRKWSQAGGGEYNFTSLNGYSSIKVGGFLPQTKVRVYIKGKTPDGNTTQTNILYVGGVNKGSKVISWTTDWTVQSYDADLSGASIGDIIKPAGGVIAAGTQLDIAWIMFRPFANDVLSTHYIGLERSTDPPEPSEGQFVIWMSDGTGKGDDGDVLCGSQAGGTTNYGTIFDYSGGAAW